MTNSLKTKKRKFSSRVSEEKTHFAGTSFFLISKLKIFLIEFLLVVKGKKCEDSFYENALFSFCKSGTLDILFAIINSIQTFIKIVP